MIEIMMAWIMLIAAMIHREPDYYIAAGVFAVAGNINMIYHKIFPGK